MRRHIGAFDLSNKAKILLTKKELKLVAGGSSKRIGQHNPYRLRQYIKLLRVLRNKYKDLTQRQKSLGKVKNMGTQSFRTIAKVKIFDRLLRTFEAQSDSQRTATEEQNKLDHEQHYDLDGVTQVADKIVIPANVYKKKKQLNQSTTLKG